MSNKLGGTYCVPKTMANHLGVHCVAVEMRPAPQKHRERQQGNWVVEVRWQMK